MKKIIRTIFVTLLLSQSSIVNAQHGVSPGWTTDVELPIPPNTNKVRGVLYSNMAVLSNGKRIVFLNKQDGSGGIFYTYSYDGINWSIPELFAPDSLVIGLSSAKVMADDNDTLHIVWSSQLPKALYYTKMDSALNIVMDSVRISDNPDFNIYNGVYPSVDLKGRIHVMWHEGNTHTDLPEIYYSRSTDGGTTWSIKNPLSTQDGLSSAFPRGQFNAYAGDTLAIFWRDSVSSFTKDWDINMVVSQNGGATWSAPVSINSNHNFQGDPDLVIAPDGRFHLFYHEADTLDPYWGYRILYGYSDDMGVTWNPSPIFKDTISFAQRSYLCEGSRYDIQNNVLWTFWKEEDIIGLQGGDMLCAYSLDNGLSWSTPEYLTDHDSTSVGFKSAALLPNGGVAINYEIPNYPVQGQMRVLYKERMPLALSVNQSIKNNQVNIYPNPTTGNVRVQFGEIQVQEVEVYDIKGQIIFRNQVSSNQTTLDLDLGSYSKGIYIIQLKTMDTILTKKIIKQ